MTAPSARRAPSGTGPIRGQLADITRDGYDPLAHLGQTRSFSGVTLRFAPDLDEGEWGATQWVALPAGLGHRATITLRPGLSSTEVRSTLAHELVHVERGYPGPEYAELDEAVVDLVAASRLIPVQALASLHQSVAERGLDQVAYALQVDAGVVEAGLRLVAAVSSPQTSVVDGTGSRS